jgi:hypothetical protein
VALTGISIAAIAKFIFCKTQQKIAAKIQIGLYVSVAWESAFQTIF